MAPLHPTSRQHLSTQSQNGGENHIDDSEDDSSLHARKNQNVEPTLVHRLTHDRSILAIVVAGEYVYAGTQGGQILVFTLDTFERIKVIEAHQGSILGFCLSEDEKWLLSCAGDRFVNLFETSTLKHLVSVYSSYDLGDIFCVSYSDRLGHVYLGAQNTSIQWYEMTGYETRPAPDPLSHPSLRPDRFFDSRGPGGVSSAPSLSRSSTEASIRTEQPGRCVQIPKDQIRQFAHFGYVYCMLIAKNISFAGRATEEILISGGGDGAVKLWDLTGDAIEELGTLSSDRDEGESVLALILDDTILYTGRIDGEIDLWDLETRQLLRVIKAHEYDILSLAIGGGMLFSAAVDGEIKAFNQRHEETTTWKAHDGRVLASSLTRSRERMLYITGGSDDSVGIWDVTDCSESPKTIATPKTSHGQLLDSLKQFISYRTVSGDPRFQSECRRGASFLRSLFKNFGAKTELLYADESFNPLVYARFTGTAPVSKRRTIMFYSHYDVISAENLRLTWASDPFTMAGRDGYLYGRGVSDNKGPIIAAIYAVAEIVAQKSLEADVVFLVEGEEESGSRGFKRAVKRNKELFGNIDFILLANSYWVDDLRPCLNYGLRGNVHSTIQIQSEHPDLHSGVDGSRRLDEPVKDLVMLLSKLTGPHGRVLLPGFYDPILPVTDSEKRLYDDISDYLLSHDPNLTTPDELTKSLMSRWREASLTIHNFKNSGPNNSSVIPHAAEAAVSFRLVPNQDCDSVISQLNGFLHSEFEKLQSSNTLSIRINRFAEPWLGDIHNELYQILNRAVTDVWNLKRRRRSSTSQGKPINPAAVTRPQTQNENGSALRRPSEGKPAPTTSTILALSSISPPTSPTSLTDVSGDNTFDWSAIHEEAEEKSTATSPRGKRTRHSGRRKSSTTSASTSSQNSTSKTRPTTSAVESKTEAPTSPPFTSPLFIREGGSIPAVRYLETEFDAPAAHLPCGQASDNAHLDNERFRVLNLWSTLEILRRVFVDLGKI